jgi:hypothetical protein
VGDISAHSGTLSSRSWLFFLIRSINTNIGVICLTRPQGHDLMSTLTITPLMLFRPSMMYYQCLSPFFSGVRVVRSLVFCVVFCVSLFVLLSFFFLSLCDLSFFDLRNG